MPKRVATINGSTRPMPAFRHLADTSHENALFRQATALQAAISNSVHFSSIATDAKGVIQIFNVGAERMLGYAASEVVDRLTPADLHDSQELIARARLLSEEFGMPIQPGFDALVFKASRGIADIYELTKIRKDGSRFPAIVSVTGLRNAQGEVIGYLLIGTNDSVRKQLADETDRQRALLARLSSSRVAELSVSRDTAEAANLAKSAFLTNMSHELRTPMNGIMGMTELALSCATDPQQIKWLQKSAEASTHLLGVINDILDLSRIEAGEMTLRDAPFSLGDVIDEVLDMLIEQAHHKGLTLSCELDQSLKGQVSGDAMRVKQILLNFVGNAIKFSESGRIHDSARPEGGEGPAARLRIDVADQGIGMNPVQQARLFRAFSQVDDSSTRKRGGSGLGLAICQRLAKMMGGDVGVVSDKGVGSVFWVTVALRLAPSDPLSPADRSAQSERALLRRDFAGRSILLGEDDPVSMEIAQFMIRDAWLHVDVAATGEEVLDLARRNPGRYAMVLLDINMPVMDGLDAARALRELPDFALTPILAMTASAFDDDKARCLAAGMDGHISKPVTSKVLYATTWRHLVGVKPRPG